MFKTDSTIRLSQWLFGWRVEMLEAEGRSLDGLDPFTSECFFVCRTMRIFSLRDSASTRFILIVAKKSLLTGEQVLEDFVCSCVCGSGAQYLHHKCHHKM